MKKSFCICLAALLSGCATARLKTGQSLTNAGQTSGKTGNAMLAASAVWWPLIPIGVAIWIPAEIIGAALYYPGCLLSGEEIESDPFEL